jgi:hypothetical protein
MLLAYSQINVCLEETSIHRNTNDHPYGEVPLGIQWTPRIVECADKKLQGTRE